MTNLNDLLSRTASGKKILSALQEHKKFSGNDFLGKAKKEKGKNIFQKIGKYTSKVTGPLAKVAAGMIGIPPSAIDALAKSDPTAHKALVNELVQSPQGQAAAAALQTGDGTGILKNIKPVYLVAGGAGLIALLLLMKR